MSDQAVPPVEGTPHLQRQFGLLQATALNMANMVGAGPFITIPLLMTALNGPASMLGWLAAILITIPDGMIWSELGAMMPRSGGSYGYLREGFGPRTFGRLMAFLFIWQFIFSGPLEIASGYIGFANYLGYVWVGMTGEQKMMVVAGLGVLNVALLYRRILTIARLTVLLWIGTLVTCLTVIVTGAMHFNPQIAFAPPSGGFDFSLGFLLGMGAAGRGLGSAASVGIYDYLGYYDICYIGDEVKNPGKVIPRSIIISLLGVALLYFLINLSITGVVPWQEFVPAADKKQVSDFVVSVFMERTWGAGVARAFTALILVTIFGSVFALLLGYSRIPYAAALDGCFFPIFGKLHPTKAFPYISLVVIGALAIPCSFLPLDKVIPAILTTRILVQFVGQNIAVGLLRKYQPDHPRPYRIWLYPLPNLLALVGWLYLFATSGQEAILFGLLTLAAGVGFFLVWSFRTRSWPFRAEDWDESRGSGANQ